MNKTIGLVFTIILSISFLTACVRPENTTQTIESTVLINTIETMYTVNTDPTETETTQMAPQDSSDSQNTDFYSVCTNYSKTEVEQFAKEVKKLILAKDWEKLSEYMVYPITIAGVTYEDCASFLAAPFGTHLDAASIESIRNESCTDMFCNYTGIMMGNGEVWIGEVLNEDYSSAGLHVIGLNILKATEVVQ